MKITNPPREVVKPPREIVRNRHQHIRSMLRASKGFEGAELTDWMIGHIGKLNSEVALIKKKLGMKEY